MNLRQLAYFVHVAELGSFTRASCFLQAAQPGLSAIHASGNKVALQVLPIGIPPLLVRLWK